MIAKRLDLAYQAGNREGMQKIKRYRSARLRHRRLPIRRENTALAARSPGSVLLGLYDANGLLHHVGFSSAIKAKDKPGLTDKL